MQDKELQEILTRLKSVAINDRDRDVIALLEHTTSKQVLDVATAARHDCIKYALEAYKLAGMPSQHSDSVAMLVIKVAKQFEEYILATDK